MSAPQPQYTPNTQSLNPDQASINEDELIHYQQHGYVILRNILPVSVIEEGFSIYNSWLPNLIQTWKASGLFTGTLQSQTITDQFYEAWQLSGRPAFRRQPFKHLISAPMYRFFKNPYFLKIASQLLGTPELSMHGVYNGRAQPPHSAWATPGWHQDAQFWDEDFGEETDKARKTHVVSLWFPLHYVDEHSGCLQVISTQHTQKQLFPHFPMDYDNTGFLGMDQALANSFPKEQFYMNAGDMLALSQINLHKASDNTADRMRYSYDLRYEATATRTTVGRKYGFIAQSLEDPASETSMETWIKTRDLFLEWEQQQTS